MGSRRGGTGAVGSRRWGAGADWPWAHGAQLRAGGAARGTPECAGVPQVESVGPSLPTREFSAVFPLCGPVYDDPFPDTGDR